MAATLAQIADELYGLIPEEFTPRRNALSRDAKPGDPNLARDIVLLRKPTPAAWVINSLARHRPDQLDEALALGERLREAQEQLDRDELQALTKQRRAVVSALAREGSALAEELGHPVSASVADEVAQTLQAAMTDAAASAALRSGRLLRPLAASGFDAVDLTDAVALPGGIAPPPPARAPSPPKDPAARAEATAAAKLAAEREAARKKAVADADKAVDAAEAALDAVDAQIQRVDRRRDDLELELARAEARVRDVRADIASIDREGRALGRDRDKAVRAAESANDEAARLREH